MRVLIIEDEEITSNQLRSDLMQMDASLNIVSILRSVSDGLLWFQNNEMPDLIFSDIELLDGNVFALFSKIEITSPIIFTTAYDQFLLNAFQTKGIAYILKPYDYQHVLDSYEKYKGLKKVFGQPSTFNSELITQLKQVLQSSEKQYKQRFTVKMKNGIHILAVDLIAFFQAEQGLIFAYEANQKRHAIIGTLSEIEASLDPKKFFRINRSEIVSIDYIEKIEPYFNDRLSIKLKSMDITLQTSTNKTAEFRKWLE
jgi:two-component system, LytTR family, response regulator LytT